MAVSKAQQKAVTKYVKSKYDRFGITMPKGNLDSIKARADAQGQSVNAYINAAIDGRIAQEDSGMSLPSNVLKVAEAPEGYGAVLLPLEAIKSAQEAAQGAREDIPAFISRAVEIQAQRDEIGRRMKGEKTNE